MQNRTVLTRQPGLSFLLWIESNYQDLEFDQFYIVPHACGTHAQQSHLVMLCFCNFFSTKTLELNKNICIMIK